MTQACQTAGALANPRSDTRVGVFRHPCRLILPLMRAAHGLWPKPHKVEAELARAAGVDVRTAERWLAQRTSISADSLAALLRSEHGLHFLEALMGDAAPGWWRAFRRGCERAELRARARRFDQMMRDRDIHVLGGTSLFRLAKVPDAAGLAAALRGQGVHVRVFEYQPQWMRFGLPADEVEFWRRFDAALNP